MHLVYDDIKYSPHAISNVNQLLSFFVADVKCGVYEINKNHRANATHGPRVDRTEALLVRRGPGPGPGLVLTLGHTQYLMPN